MFIQHVKDWLLLQTVSLVFAFVYLVLFVRYRFGQLLTGRHS